MITNVSAPCLLVAMPSMLDHNFSKSVLLLVEHNSEGAVGFVINRPSTVPLKSMISVIDRDVPQSIPAWYGGPVDTGTALILHTRKPTDGDTEIGHGIYLSTSGRILDSLIDESQKTISDLALGKANLDVLNPYRFLVGYAGWGPGQLDDEIRAGAWLLHNVDRDLILNTPWSEMWDQMTAKMGLDKRLSSTIPPISHSTYLN